MFSYTLIVFTALVALTLETSAAVLSPQARSVAPERRGATVAPQPTQGPAYLAAPEYIQVEAAYANGGRWGGYGPATWAFQFNGSNYKEEPFNIQLFPSDSGDAWHSAKPTATLACSIYATGAVTGNPIFSLTSVSPWYVQPTGTFGGGSGMSCTPA